MSTTYLSSEHFASTKYGKLRMLSPSPSSRGSHKKVDWACDCGKTVSVAVCSVVSGNTSSCRKCNLISLEESRTRKFGSLRLKVPTDFLPGSRSKLTWVCDCGREKDIQPLSVTTGHTSSCGNCRVMSAEDWRTSKFGNLSMLDPRDLHLGSHEVVTWACDCGRTTDVASNIVTSGHTKSCGKCRHGDPDYWAKPSYGRLIMDPFFPVSAGSNKEVSWSCSCGADTKQDVYTVSSGKVKSCGRCILAAKNWHSLNIQALRDLVCPVSPSDFPSGHLVPLETIVGVDTPFRARCGICGGEYGPQISNLRRGSSLSCGCASYHTSSPSKEIADFVRSLGLEAELEHAVDGLRYDLFVPSAKLVIEHNGLRWHSLPGSKERDVRKRLVAVEAGYSYLMVYEDEWASSRHKVESLLRNRLVRSSPVSLRPVACSFRLVSSARSSPFYEAKHYIGACKASLHYGVFFGDVLVACASFSVPTRQSSHPWELLRMASHPGYRVHGVWSKVFRAFVRDNDPSSVVSFSDNRLFPGSVYRAIGFSHDGDVRPDYFWVKSGKRHHKSGLRKKGSERDSGLTETELREADGYRKIWDLGKTRWVWRRDATL